MVLLPDMDVLFFDPLLTSSGDRIWICQTPLQASGSPICRAISNATDSWCWIWICCALLQATEGISERPIRRATTIHLVNSADGNADYVDPVSIKHIIQMM